MPKCLPSASAKICEAEPVVGYMAAFLLTSGDRGGERELYNVEHLLELWDEIHRRVPRAQLWLLGKAGPGLRARVAGRDDIVCFGHVPRDEMLTYVANFDVALYPRAADQGIQAAKVADYLGGGAPIVSYDYEVVSELRGTGAALLVPDAREFVEAVVRLLEDDGERGALREAARRLGRERDWDELGRRYGEILDRYLS